MGAYGGTPEASMSTSDSGNITDLNIDGEVDYRDMKLLINSWLYECLLLPEDLNRDGIVNFTDFSIFAHILGFPGPASHPNPPDGAAPVNITADLGWKAGRGATSHDVYFGTSNPPPFIRNQPYTIYDPGTMDYITMYYWRIDEVNKWGTTMGPVWSFTTIMSPPPLGQASNPNPVDGATEVCIYADLGWTSGSATSHVIYFGTSNPPPFMGNQTATTFNPGAITENTKYYWRIDEVNTGGKSTGTTWFFMNSIPPPPL